MSSSPSSPESPDADQKKRGRPCLDDDNVSTAQSERAKLICKRKYARKYREKIRADLRVKEELRQLLGKVEEDNRRLRETLDALKQENAFIIQNLVALASIPPPAISPFAFSDLMSSALQFRAPTYSLTTPLQPFNGGNR